MKVNNPSPPKFPILINNEDEGVKMEMRLHNLGWKHITDHTLKNEYFAHFPMEVRQSKSPKQYYFL